MNILFSAKFSTSKHTFNGEIGYTSLEPKHVEQLRDKIISRCKKEVSTLCNRWGVSGKDLISLEIYYNDILRELGDSEVTVFEWRKL